MFTHVYSARNGTRSDSANVSMRNRFPRPRALVYLFLAFFLMLPVFVNRVDAAELKGLGPIEFGMTKQEAWNAIGGQGEWERSSDSGGLLNYEYQFQGSIEKWQLTQSFANGQAANAFARYAPIAFSPQSCQVRGKFFADKIEKQHEASPLVRKGTPFHDFFWMGEQDSYAIYTVYNFTFEKGAYIWMTVTATSTQICQIDVSYFEPSAEPIPF